MHTLTPAMETIVVVDLVDPQYKQLSLLMPGYIYSGGYNRTFALLAYSKYFSERRHSLWVCWYATAQNTSTAVHCNQIHSEARFNMNFWLSNYCG